MCAMPQSSRTMVTLRDSCAHRAASELSAAPNAKDADTVAKRTSSLFMSSTFLSFTVNCSPESVHNRTLLSQARTRPARILGRKYSVYRCLQESEDWCPYCTCTIRNHGRSTAGCQKAQDDPLD